MTFICRLTLHNKCHFKNFEYMSLFKEFYIPNPGIFGIDACATLAISCSFRVFAFS